MSDAFPYEKQRKASVILRGIRYEDAGAVAQLSGELGYPVSGPRMERRIRVHMALSDHVTYVACLPADRVVGWIYVGIVHHLQA